MFKVLDSGTITNTTYTIRCNYFIFSKFMVISIQGNGKNLPADNNIIFKGLPTDYYEMVSIVGGNRNTNRQMIYKSDGTLMIKTGNLEIQYDYYGQLITFKNN